MSAKRSSPAGGDTRSGDHDLTLVERAREGDRGAFEELVRRHADRLFTVVLRFGVDRATAEEVVQETFLRAWRGIGGFKGEAQFFTWLYRIGINEAKRHMARQVTRGDELKGGESPLGRVPDWSEAPDRRAEQHDLRAALERAVRALPEAYRMPLILRDIEGLSTREAAAVMKLREAAFKSRLHRARLAVRQAIEDHLGEEGER